MIHIKERLMQYADKYSGCYKYAGVYVKVIQDMIEQLLAAWKRTRKKMVGFLLVRDCRKAEHISLL